MCNKIAIRVCRSFDNHMILHVIFADCKTALEARPNNWPTVLVDNMKPFFRLRAETISIHAYQINGKSLKEANANNNQCAKNPFHFKCPSIHRHPN